MKNKSCSSHWELLPGIGLGNVTFMMSRLQVTAFDDILGKITSEHNPADLKNHVWDTYELLKDFITESEMKEIMEAIEAANADDPRGVILIQHRMATGLTLEYEDEQLTEICADDRAKQLHFNLIPIFSTSPLSLVKKMATELKENPIVKDDELVFPKNNIFLFSFLRKDLTEGNPQNRTMMWRVKPRILGTDLSEYIPLKII
ncbi:hypothetical protein [Sphingobacterium prati]|uniref:hypothetical protein n=1 Tax=Sphingobacterium prati TaxID=2737006 RepID=UPI001555178B|nr:hypothetical protein [Sphingobacterium prati]NPE45726.1 hypothetical protein [Sphingobacterium prati]